MTKKPEHPFSEVIRDVQLALNLIRNSRYKGGLYKNTYDLVAELERHLALAPPNREAIIELARDKYQTDDVEIDDDARVVPSDKGSWWVQAWVWIRP